MILKVAVRILSVIAFVVCQNDVEKNNGTKAPNEFTSRDSTNYVSRERPVVLKCKCLGNQVVVGENCEDEVTDIEVYVKEVGFVKVRTTEFSSITVKDLECLDGAVERFIADPSFAFVQDGSLYDIEGYKLIKAGDFCMDHFKEKNETRAVAKVCEPPPSVPQCCPKGHIMNLSSQCNYEGGYLPFEPPFAFKAKFTNLSGPVHKIDSCQEGYDLTVANLTNSSSLFSLSISNLGKAALQKRSFMFHLGTEFDSSEFCVALKKNSNSYYYVAYFCQVNDTYQHQRSCTDKICSRKCCPLNHVFNMDYNICLPDTSNDRIEQTLFERGLSPSHNVSQNNIISGPPLCADYVELNQPFNLSNEGDLYFGTSSNAYRPTDYCIENFRNGDTIEEKAYVCPNGGPPCAWKNSVVVFLLGISCLFLCLTIVVYVGVKDLRSRMSGKCLISETTALFASYVALIVLKSFDPQPDTPCRGLGVTAYISILASFFWLNVMCFDMWSTIRSNRPMSDGSGTNGRFLGYCLYGWGLPATLGIVAAVIDDLPQNESYESLLRPNIGNGSCFFRGSVAKWVYLYSFIVILLLINVGFFVHVVVILMRAEQDNRKMFSGQGRSAGGKNRTIDQRFWMYMKLLVVMGLSWIGEVIAFHYDSVQYSCYVWLVPDVVNALRGFFIFLIFVCKKATIKKIASTCNSLIALATGRHVFSLHSSSRDAAKTRTSNLSSAFNTHHDKVEFQPSRKKDSATAF